MPSGETAVSPSRFICIMSSKVMGRLAGAGVWAGADSDSTDEDLSVGAPDWAGQNGVREKANARKTAKEGLRTDCLFARSGLLLRTKRKCTPEGQFSVVSGQ